MNAYQPTSADDILKSVCSVFDNKLAAGIDPVADGEMDEDKLHNTGRGVVELESIAEDNALPDSVGNCLRRHYII